MSADTLIESRPRRAAELGIGPPVLRGTRTVHLVKDRRTGRFFEIGVKEEFVIARLDGSRTLAEIGADYTERFGTVLDERGWGAILSALWRKSFLSTPGARPAPAPSTTDTAAAPARRGFSGSMSWGDPRFLLDGLHRRLRWVFHPVCGAVLLVLCLAMLGYLAAHTGELLSQFRVLYRHPELAVLAGVLLWISSALHEVGHGLCCRHYGGTATDIGVRWRLPVIMFYCEADDVLVLRSRRQRIVTAAAGVLVNLVFLLPFFALWLVLPDGDVTHDSISALLLFGVLRGLVNYLPLPNLDGYLILQHGWNALELGPQTWKYLRHPDRSGYPARARRIYRGYAVLFALAVLLAVAAGAWLVWNLTGGPARYVVLGLLGLWVLVSLALTVVRGRKTQGGTGAGGDKPAEMDTVDTPVTGRENGSHRAYAEASVLAERGSSPVNTQSVNEPDEPVVVVRELRKRYGEVDAVAGTSFSIGRGEFFGILGPNGAGKTTLIEIIEGQRTPDSGEVTLFGESPWPRKLSVYNRIGIQTQASSFFPDLNALEHLETVAGLYQLSRADAASALATVDLTGSAGVRVTKLSGGQRQRLAIASALVHKPDLLFLDEPTAALDPESRRGLWSLLRELRAGGTSIVYTTHHLDEAEALCDRVAIIRSGAVVGLDTPRELVRAAGGQSRVSVPSDLIGLEAVTAMAGVTGARVDGGNIEITTDAVAEALASLGAVVDLGAVETKRPTLEDVYLNLTGAEFSQ